MDEQSTTQSTTLGDDEILRVEDDEPGQSTDDADGDDTDTTDGDADDADADDSDSDDQ